MIEDKDSLWEHSDDEEQGAAIADDEGDVEVFVERGSDSLVDKKEPVDSAEEVDENDDQILSPGDISNTSRPMRSRRRLRNVITETPRAILNLWSEKASFETLIGDGILRTVLMHTNKKL